MLDFHAHVLPGADHGSDGLQTSLRQLTLAEQAGIDVLIATPHFYPQRDDFDRFLRKRARALAELRENYAGPIRLFAGCEVHMCVGLDHLDGLEELCVPGTRVMLCELPFRDLPSGMTETFERLMEDFEITPVLAHVDRYEPTVIENLFGIGLTGQLNAEPFSRHFHRRRLLPWIDRGQIVALGSDIHGTQTGYAHYRKAVDFLGARFDTIEARARKLIGAALERE